MLSSSCLSKSGLSVETRRTQGRDDSGVTSMDREITGIRGWQRMPRTIDGLSGSACLHAISRWGFS
jgi:hypothetical protein